MSYVCMILLTFGRVFYGLMRKFFFKVYFKFIFLCSMISGCCFCYIYVKNSTAFDKKLTIPIKHGGGCVLFCGCSKEPGHLAVTDGSTFSSLLFPEFSTFSFTHEPQALFNMVEFKGSAKSVSNPSSACEKLISYRNRLTRFGSFFHLNESDHHLDTSFYVFWLSIIL